MYTPEQVLDIAQSIYVALPKLLDAPLNSEVQTTLKPLLESEDAKQVWEVLSRYPQTQQWLTKYSDIENSTKTRSDSQQHGDMVPQGSELIYACPHCNYRDIVFFIGMVPEPCKNHPDAVMQLA